MALTTAVTTLTGDFEVFRLAETTRIAEEAQLAEAVQVAEKARVAAEQARQNAVTRPEASTLQATSPKQPAAVAPVRPPPPNGGCSNMMGCGHLVGTPSSPVAG